MPGAPPDPGPALLVPGSQLGKYLLVKRLAIGGMAEIHLARATGIKGFEKLVVLKRILPQHAQNEDFITMFLDEARIAATLHHPNVGQVYDIGEDGGIYWFTMEYVHGEDVRQILKVAASQKRTLGLHHAIQIVCAVAQGLHYAHEKRGPDGKPLGIVHRDVSPSNIIVTYDGQVKLVDFGIAKAASRSFETRSGTIKGKVSYMAPEQCQGQKIDRRSDVFALGIVLHELTTASRLFKGDSDLDVMRTIVFEDIPLPSSKREGYPPGLEAIVMKALRKDPNERYATTEDLQVDLEAFAREEKLSLSSIELSRYMQSLFGKREEPWEAIAAAAAAGREPEIAIESGTSAAKPAALAQGSNSAILGESLPPPSRRRPWAIFAALIGVMLAGVVALVIVFGGEKPGSSTLPAGAATTPTPVPVPVPTPVPVPVPKPETPKPESPKPETPIAAAVDAGVPATTTTSGSQDRGKPDRKRDRRDRKPPATPTPSPSPSASPSPSPSPAQPEWDEDSPLLP